MCQCVSSFTRYRGCGCARYHATLPCLKAFDRSLKWCQPSGYMTGEVVDGDCLECKPAFDNKSGLMPRIKINFKPRPKPEPEPELEPEPIPEPEPEQPKTGINYTPRLEPNPSHNIRQANVHNGEKTGPNAKILNHPLDLIPGMSFCDDVCSFLGDQIPANFLFSNKNPITFPARQVLHKTRPLKQNAPVQNAPVTHRGTFAQINQQHNQFERLTREERENHKATHFLGWLDRLEQPEADAGGLTGEATVAGGYPEPLEPTPGAVRPNPEVVRQQRRLNSARRQHKAEQRGIMSPLRVTVPVRDDYDLTARHHTLSASQRSALNRRGYSTAKRLCVISRRQCRRTWP